MEVKDKSSEPRKTSAGEGVDDTPWVSPDVLAAQAGQQVEMGKDLSENDPNNE